MQIFIDESGIFANPNSQAQAVSVVAALVIPDLHVQSLFFAYSKLKHDWGFGKGEAKGSKLNERQLAQIFKLLEQYDCLAQIVVMDSAVHTDEDVSNHKHEQARKLIANLTPEHQPGMIRDLHELKFMLEQMSNPLFLQSIATTTVVESVLRVATLYYSLRIPSELGTFSWVLDAKDKTKTPYEKWWSSMVVAFLQTRSFQRPLATLEGADYSYFKRFEGTLDNAPEYLRKHVPGDPSPFHYVNMNLLLSEQIQFMGSKKSEGLQLADTVATTLRRALRGNLQKDGWLGLARILIKENPQAIHLLTINEPRSPKDIVYNAPRSHIISTLSAMAKSMWDGVDLPRS